MTRHMPEGTVLKTKKNGIIDHLGIVLYEGTDQKIIHNTPKLGGVVVTSVEEFCGGEEFYIMKHETSLPLWRIAENARALSGKRWSLFYNCQHFVEEACGRKPFSYQLNQLTLLLFASSLLLMVKK